RRSPGGRLPPSDRPGSGLDRAESSPSSCPKGNNLRGRSPIGVRKDTAPSASSSPSAPRLLAIGVVQRSLSFVISHWSLGNPAAINFLTNRHQKHVTRSLRCTATGILFRCRSPRLSRRTRQLFRGPIGPVFGALKIPHVADHPLMIQDAASPF